MTESDLFAVNVEAAIYRGGAYLLIERAAAEEHAAGELGLVGGTVEHDAPDDALKSTVTREIREEVGVEVESLHYVHSSTFVTEQGTPCVNVVFLCRHVAGEAKPREPEEVASVHWLTPREVEAHEDVKPWTTDYVEHSDEKRRELGW